MSDRPDLDRLVTDWLTAEAPARAPAWVLSTAVERVADVGQERAIGLDVGGWLDGWSRRSAPMRGAIAVGLIVLLLAAIASAGAVVLREVRGPALATTAGWVAFTVEGLTRQSESVIYLVRDGVEEYRLTGADEDAVREVCPRFSPDGTRLVYAEGPPRSVDDRGVAVVIVSLGPSGRPTGAPVRTTVESWGGACPTWSPDGQSVAFLDSGPTLWTMDVDGTTTRIGGWGVTNTMSRIDWSPDGTGVVATEYSGSRIWMVPVDGQGARVLRTADSGVQFGAAPEHDGARWSPDGTRIGVVEERYVADPASGATRYVGSSIRIDDLAGAEPPVTLEDGVMFAWSPDGDRIAYVRSGERSGREVSELVVANASGGNARVIAADARYVRGVVWAPDGTRILFAADAGLSGQLMVVPATGAAAPVALTRHGHPFEWTNSDDISWQAVAP